MSNRIESNTSHTKTDPSEHADPTEHADAAGKRTEQRARGATAALSAGAQALVSRSQSARVDVARKAIEPLARELEGHGVDTEALAKGFGRTSFGSKRVADEARFAFMKRALTNNPELAGRAIAIRTRGLSADDRATVARAAGEAGSTGLRKYADAERAIATLGKFGRDERADIAGMVRAGERLGVAVAVEHDELTRIARENMAPSLEEKRAEAVRGVMREAAQWDWLLGEVNQMDRSFKHSSRSGEVVVGLVNASATVTGLAYGAVAAAFDGGKRFGEAVDDADRAGRRMFGESRGVIDIAERTAMEFRDAYGAHREAAQRQEDAIGRGDYREINETAAQMASYEHWMANTARRLFEHEGPRAQRAAAAWNGEVVHATVEAVTVGAAATVHAGTDVSLKTAEEIAKFVAHESDNLAAEGGIVREVSHAIPH